MLVEGHFFILILILIFLIKFFIIYIRVILIEL